MNSVFLVYPASRHVTLQELEAKLPDEYASTEVRDPDERNIRLRNEEGLAEYVWLTHYTNENILDEMEEEEGLFLLSLIPDPDFFALNFSLAFTSLEFVKAVLVNFLDDPDVVVDNDTGIFLRGPEFKRQLEEKPGWNWILEDYTNRGIL